MSIFEYFLALEDVFESNGYNLTNVNFDCGPNYNHLPDGTYIAAMLNGILNVSFECSTNDDRDLAFLEDHAIFKPFGLLPSSIEIYTRGVDDIDSFFVSFHMVNK